MTKAQEKYKFYSKNARDWGKKSGNKANGKDSSKEPMKSNKNYKRRNKYARKSKEICC